jgi:signal transduction histidine kinase
MSEKFKILMIEDSDEDAELVLRFVKKLERDLYYKRVQTEEELREACANSEWDLILSDYSLPQFSGPEALRILNELQSEVPLILVSGTIGEETAVEALKMGAADYVLKSNLGRLTTAIEHAVRTKKVEIEKRQLKKQLEHAQKMQAVGRLAGGVAHDVNNALAAITIYAEMALEQIDALELKEAKESVKGILASQQTAAGIVKQLLSFSRRNIEPNQMINSCEVLERMQPLLKALLGAPIDLKTNLPSEVVPIFANPTQIEQIIMNLAINARDAMPNGGTFTLSLSTTEIQEPPIKARIPAVPGRYACLSARDTGAGMSHEVLEHLFEPFFTTKDIGKGTGLGLAVVYGIVKQANGTLLVDSQIDRGSEFRVFWPIANTSNKSETKVSSISDLSASPSDSTVLLVDDEVPLRRLLSSMLKECGYNVVEASNGADALKMIAAQNLSFRLLISDIVMPQMSGIELAQRIRSRAPDVHVLFLSGYANETLEEFKMSSTWFLQKPFTSKSFVDKVVEILGGRLLKSS